MLSYVHRQRERFGRTPTTLGVVVYATLTLGQASLGCRDDDCQHDWQCGEAQICIPFEARNECVTAPVCDSNADCSSNEPCILRSNRIVEEGSHDPFTLDEPAKQTCGGFEGPQEVTEPQSGCGPNGSDDESDGGSGGTGGSGGSGNGGSGNATNVGGAGASGGAGGAGASGGSGGTGTSGGAGGSDSGGSGGAGGSGGGA